MEIIQSIIELRTHLELLRGDGGSIGLVPTMGALHEGHASLVKQCVAENSSSVVSVFVNPTQFNNPEDFRFYPRSPRKDYALCESLGVKVVFAPAAVEIYPRPDERVFDFGLLDKVMEGEFRPGHFNGVAQVVSKLFNLVEPDKAYFGEKDFQQLAVVKEMVKQLSIPVEIVGVPTVREKSGLALSSRNQRLTVQQREEASLIYHILKESLTMMGEGTPGQIAGYVTDEINKVPALRVEYYLIVDGETLQPVSSWQEAAHVVGCIAVYCGDVRLIDNIRYK